MSSSHQAPGGNGRPGKRRITRADMFAVAAAISVVALIDSEIIAYGVPGILAGTSLLHLPDSVGFAGVALLGAICLWLGVWLVGQVWKVEQAMRAGRDPARDAEAGC